MQQTICGLAIVDMKFISQVSPNVNISIYEKVPHVKCYPLTVKCTLSAHPSNSSENNGDLSKRFMSFFDPAQQKMYAKTMCRIMQQLQAQVLPCHDILLHISLAMPLDVYPIPNACN